jgi:L-fuconolactonase
MEDVIDPEIPIIDPHHHLWHHQPPPLAAPVYGWEKVMRQKARYLLDELLTDLGSGHNIVATVFMECGSHYRAEGPPELGPVGETEFVARVAAEADSRAASTTRVCAGIVGHVDLTIGDRVQAVLEAHLLAGEGRFRGVRQSASYDADQRVLANLNAASPDLYGSDDFRAGFRWIGQMGLVFDAWVVEPQLPQLIDLARTFPGAPIVLDHLATPLGLGRYSGRQAERFPIWRKNIQELARSPNVTVKVGGLGMDFCHFPSFLADPPFNSEQLAAEWRPYIETCVEAFGADRCMFESNYPAEAGAGAYATIWNAFKRAVAGASADEKTALFSGAADRVYALGFA